MQLQKNIKSLIKVCTIKRISGRICVFCENDIFNRLITIPGVARVSQGYECELDLDSMINCGIQVMRECPNIKSFKVNARRNHTNFEFDSMQMNQIIGGALSDKFPKVKVQMKNPDLEVRVEAIQSKAYIYGKSEPGVGGLPVGTGGRVVALLSSGIDSPVALWKIARRGAQVIGVHFSGAPIVSSESEYLVKEIADILSKSGTIQKLYIVRIGKYQKKIAEDSPEKLRIILYRRFMYKIAEQIAINENAKALITGESLGQVASQTLDNLGVTDAAVNLPVFRPLIGSDKIEIIDRARRINTLDISSEQAPDCCTLYMPKNPETHAKLIYVELAEQSFNYDSWISQAIDSAILVEPERE